MILRNNITSSSSTSIWYFPCNGLLITEIQFAISSLDRLKSVECVPVILKDFLDRLRDGSGIHSELLWKRGQDVEIHILQGTPLSPPKINANVILMEMTYEDEVSIKMFLDLMTFTLIAYVHRYLSVFK